MKIQELKYNLYLVDFVEVEHEILHSLKKELDRYGLNSYEELPRADYIRLLNYFTLYSVCKNYGKLAHKKNTIWFVNETVINSDILTIIKEIKKYFPIPIYLTTSDIHSKDTAVQTEITLNIKEFRYSFDYSKFSFNKIKKFCKANNLESLLTDFKL